MKKKGLIKNRYVVLVSVYEIVGLNTQPAKDEDNNINIGCNLVEIARVWCKVRHMIGLLCAKIMSPWHNCCFCVSVVLISKFNI